MFSRLNRTLACLALVGLVVAMPVAAYAEPATSLPQPTTPLAPAALQVPDDQVLLFRTFATGTQIYACDTTDTGGAAWAFRQPEATLTDE